MQRLTDSVTSTFQLETKDERLAACLQGGSTIVYSEKFGLGWRFGLQYAKEGWSFARVNVYFDHSHCSSAIGAATTVTVCLKAGPGSEVPPFESKTATITDFGHGPPALLGSFWPSVIVARPYMSFTVTTKVDFAPVVADPLTNTASALRQSMDDGEFADTKYYVTSKRRTSWKSPGKTRFVYANDAVLNHGVGIVPVSPSPIKEDSLLVRYQSEPMLMRDAEQYNYDSDSDIEEEDEEEEEKPKPKPKPKPNEKQQEAHRQYQPYRYSQSYYPVAAPSESDISDDTSDSSALSSDDGLHWTKRVHPGFRSMDTLVPEAVPPPFPSGQRMVLVRDTAFATWTSYVYYCYTGQVSFYLLKSKDSTSRRDKTTGTLRCSPKSMYRLADKLKNARLRALAFQAIKSSLSNSNILDESFSWFTAQYPDIQKMELELLMKFRKTPEVSRRLSRILEAVSRGEKPYAHAMLHGFLANLTGQGASTR
ncbi:hypothetical protein DEU56DRAFT_27552 [Suillus clintonianus]|uniref:uncharacterized protein n=1 Tax=Suillus clintonianus TaxID=1904413 RepID=UPI001B87557C|nr:uncharacterized protein DEU56DRAFT_27552 [Suillus clintonianus]KAG2150420.1 hypothetical protein DEU56DRAFT_27552 [Suillus clintonianus]